MKRLFGVRTPKGGVVANEWFANKMEAKKHRNYLNELHSTEGYTVCRGPDHIGKHGCKNNPHNEPRRSDEGQRGSERGRAGVDC